jgi:hypothetical protein
VYPDHWRRRLLTAEALLNLNVSREHRGFRQVLCQVRPVRRSRDLRRRVRSTRSLLREFATNAAKYGALSNSTGYIDIACSDNDGQVALTWTERGGPRIDHQSDGEGFGSLLAPATVKSQFAGKISRNWNPDGLTIRPTFPGDRVIAE